MRVVGLMSGTSMDGVDAALIDTDGEVVFRLGPSITLPYDAHIRALLVQAMEDARGITARTQRPGLLAEAERRMTDLHADAVRMLLDTVGLASSDLDLIGFHGQTVLHRPHERLTVQIGEGQRLARLLDVPVVADFRAADVAAGGQGAPLVPVFHAALAAGLENGPEQPWPVAVLNVGGVSNVTIISPGAPPIACDTGPGNALLDDFMMDRTGHPFDADGATAARGRVDEARLQHLLTHPFFQLPPPKSLDRNEFRAFVSRHGGLDELSLEDGAATLTALTAATIAGLVSHLAHKPQRWIIAGGGARNPTLCSLLAGHLGVRVENADAVGWSADALEAHAFGFLAARSLLGLAQTFPTTTGVQAPLAGGVLFQPR